MTRRASIVFQIATLGTVAMFASAPTPFYRIYQDHWHLSPVMVTTVFSAYALNLLVALHLLSRLQPANYHRRLGNPDARPAAELDIYGAVVIVLAAISLIATLASIRRVS
jgi:hypothetical protein